MWLTEFGYGLSAETGTVLVVSAGRALDSIASAATGTVLVVILTLH
jgi:hypothetical protein